MKARNCHVDSFNCAWALLNCVKYTAEIHFSYQLLKLKLGIY